MSRSHVVTIGLPVFNGARYIGTVLDDLLSQTHDDLALLISDNASEDDTESICREYADRDPRVVYIRQEKNLGGAPNFDFVLAQAKSEFFMFAAHDDRYEPFFLEESLRALKETPGALTAMTRFHAKSKRGRPFEKRRFASDFSKLADDDPYIRVASFLLDEEHAHKCNFIYGVWRLEEMKKLFAETRATIHRDSAAKPVASIDTAILSYALSKGKFVLADRLGFYKAHRSLVYDNFLAKLYYYVYRVYRFFFPVVKSKGKKYVDILDEWRESATGMIDAVLKETTLEEYQRRHILEEFRRKYRNKPIGN